MSEDKCEQCVWRGPPLKNYRKLRHCGKGRGLVEPDEPACSDFEKMEFRLELTLGDRRMEIPDWQGRPGLQPRILLMYRLYGVTPEERCKSCRHQIWHTPGTTSFAKCALTKRTSGAATDWRINWPACGRWERRETATAPKPPPPPPDGDGY
jgi:hypothetical protein